MDREQKQWKIFVSSLPKAELHLHLEGSVGPALLARILGWRNRSSLEETKKLYAFKNFKGFLKAYGRVNELLSEPEDFYHIARALCRRLAAQRILYAEVTFTPLLHTRQGLDHEETMGSILRAFKEESDGPGIALIYDTVRQWGSGAAMETAGLAARDRAAGLPVVGFGVGGDELSAPASELEAAFRLASEAGLRKFVHAGEVGGPDSVWEAVEILGADRIGHGITAQQDPLLLETLKQKGIALDICPTSNVMTGAVASFDAHPLPELLESGVPVTVGSDDPGFFGVWLEDEITRGIRSWNLSLETVRTLMQNAARHSFLPPKEKAALETRLSGVMSDECCEERY
ncbi:MAG TPA: adenosine deaminase [archaeon]|nr:adenosine deaminase [archaeon]